MGSKHRIGPLEVSPLGLGCMNLSMGYGRADDRESEQLLQEALEAGYRFFDTAAVYGMGHNESLLGRALGHCRQEFVLATKCGLSRGPDGAPRIDGRPEVLRAECEASLKRLGTEVIDLYYLHRVDPGVPIEESVGALAELVRAGKVRALGLSEISTDTLKRAHRVHPISAVQSEYSLWTRTPERRMLAACEALGISFVPFSPLGRGFLADSAKDVSRLDPEDIRATIARPRFEPDNFAANAELLEPYRAIARTVGCTPAQLALAWLRARTDINLVPIPGTRNPVHMRENLDAVAIDLDGETVMALDRLINEGTVKGSRYAEPMMSASDAERD